MRVLFIGEDPEDALAIRRALAESGRDGYRLEHAEGISRGIDRAAGDPPDVVLLELEGDGRDGLTPLTKLTRKAPHVPIVALVRPGDEELATLAVKEGAHDWLITARLDPELLVRSIRYAVERAHLTRELTDAREQLNRLTLRDELTGLYNRRGFSVLAEQQMRLARRWDAGMLLLLLDVDGLEAINDGSGRNAGDRALADIGQLVRDSFRDSDVKARVGGDEFAVLLTGAGDGTCEVIDSRLTANLERLNANADRGYKLSLSGGVAAWDPTSGTGVSELLERADHLMREQKRGMRGSLGCVG